MVSFDDMLKYEIAYRIGEPKISNEQWDKLVEETGYKEHIHDEVIGESANGRKRVPMKTPMVSLKKVYNVNDLKSWLIKNFGDDNFVIEPKLDGNAVNVSYDVQCDGTAVRRFIGSPGDGLASMVVFPNALDNVKLIGIPETLTKDEVDLFKENNAVVDNVIEIRGEAIVDRHLWTEMNPGFHYTSWRQMVAAIMCRQSGLSWVNVKKRLDAGDKDVLKSSGLLAALRKMHNLPKNVESIDVDENDLPELVKYGSKVKTIQEVVTMIAYSCSTTSGNCNAEFLQSIHSLKTFVNDGFKTENACMNRIVTNMSEWEKIEEYINIFFGKAGVAEGLRSTGAFQCDGLVFKQINGVDKDVFKTRNGELAHHPSNSIAIKLFPEGIKTEILEIYSSVTEKGNTTMHAKIKPVEYMGNVVTNINLFNQNWVDERKDWLYEGATILVTFSGDLIPVIMRPDE